MSKNDHLSVQTMEKLFDALRRKRKQMSEEEFIREVRSFEQEFLPPPAPDLSIRIDPLSDPLQVWLTVNREVSTSTAERISALLEEDRIANAAEPPA